MKKLWIITILLITPAAKGWSQSGILPVQPIPSLSLDTLSFAGFDQVFPDATNPVIRVVGAGTTSFTAGEAVRFSNKLIQYLVLEKGFRSIALLRDDWELRKLNNWLTDGSPILEEEERRLIQRSFDHSTYGNEDLVELLKWLKAFNSGHPNDPVSLKGLNFSEPMTPAHLLAKYVFPADSLSGIAITDKRSRWLDDDGAYDDILNWFRQKKEAIKQRLTGREYAELQTDLINLEYLRKFPASTETSVINYFDSCLALNVIRFSDDQKKLIVCADNSFIARTLMRTDRIRIRIRKNLGTFLDGKLGKTYYVSLTDYYDRADLFWIDPATGQSKEVQRFSDTASTAWLLHQNHHITGGMVRYEDLVRFNIPIFFNVHSLYADHTSPEALPGMIAFDMLAVFADEHAVKMIR